MSIDNYINWNDLADKIRLSPFYWRGWCSAYRTCFAWNEI